MRETYYTPKYNSDARPVFVLALIFSAIIILIAAGPNIVAGWVASLGVSP